jgi:hypothetical protein
MGSAGFESPVALRQRLDRNKSGPIDSSSLYKIAHITLLICVFAFLFMTVATLVERHTRHVMLAKVANKDTQTIVSALITQAKTLPNELYKSLTWDRGMLRFSF